MYASEFKCEIQCPFIDLFSPRGTLTKTCSRLVFGQVTRRTRWPRIIGSCENLPGYPDTRYIATCAKTCRKVLPPPALRQNIKLCPADWLLFGLPAIRQCSNSLPTEVSLRIIVKIFVFNE